MMNLQDLLQLLSQTADGAYIVDERQRIVAWNDAAESLLGFSAQSVQGLPCHQIIGGHGDGGCVICRRNCQPFVASQRGEIVPSFDVQVRTADGHSRWVNAGIISMEARDEQGKPIRALIHLVRDVEVRKQAESFALQVAAQARQLTAAAQEPGPSPEASSRIGSLTPREYEVLCLLAQGLGTKAIAARLVIGTSTVRNHVQRILHKLNVHSRLEAASLAREHRLVE